MGTSWTSVISAIPAAVATIAAVAKQSSTPSSSPSSSPAVSTPAVSTPAQTPGSTDYGELIRSAIASGADAATVQGLVDKRIDKAASTPGLEQYAFDGIYNDAMAYIDKQSKADAAARQLQQVYDPYEGAYAQALAAQKAASEAAVQRAVNDLNAQKTDTGSEYADMFRQLYINKMNAQKNLNQQLGAQGITGGMAETSRLGLDTAYSEALRKGEQERIKTISDLDRAITDTQLSGDISYAQAAAELARANADSYAGVLSNLLSYYGNNEQFAQQQAASEAADNRAYAYQIAMQMLGSGTMPTDELLATAGIGKSDAETIAANALAAANTPKYSGDGTKKYNATQAETALAAAINGDTSDAVRSIVESYYGLPLETVLASYGYTPGYTTDPGASPGTGMSPAYFGIATGAENLTLRGATGLEVKNYLDDALSTKKINSTEYDAIVNYVYRLMTAW